MLFFVAMVISPIEQQLRDALQPHGFRLAVLFGSLARGEATQESDVDIAVLGQKPLAVVQKRQIVGDLALLLGRPIDLIDLYDVGEPLLGVILSEGKRVIGDAAEWGRLTYRHLVNQADFIPLQNRILKARRDAWIKP